MDGSTATEVEDGVAVDVVVSSTGNGLEVGLSSASGGQQNALSMSYNAHASVPDSIFKAPAMRSAHVAVLSSYSGT